ncbi:MAG: membrane protein insertion efficiency factor YidD [Candidatus Omnitrophica bacterium]|nr:membrane protein insertion efficiency factor YidD [Candidatus Omnitrophota bacterium]
MAWISIKIIKAYQKLSHAFFPQTCRFHPSCSQYALEAIQMYGFIKGGIKAIIRIIKCSPLSQGGYDPVR